MAKHAHASVEPIKLGDIEVDYKFNVRGRPDVEAEKGAKREDDETSLASLAAHIKRHGCPPIIVARQEGKKKPYFLIAGFRRMTAMLEILEWGPETSVYAMVHAPMSDKERVTANLAENLQREDLHPAEQAEGFARLEKLGSSSKEIASSVGISQSHVNNLLRLKANLSPRVWKAWAEGNSGRGLRFFLQEILPAGDHKAQEARFFGDKATTGAAEATAPTGGNTTPREPRGTSRQPIKEVERAIQTAREALRDGNLDSSMRSRYTALIAAWEWAMDDSKSCPISLPEKSKGRPKSAKASEKDADTDDTDD